MENKIFVRMQELKHLLGDINRRTIDRWEETKQFPKRIRLNARHNVWILKEVEDWIKERRNESVSHVERDVPLDKTT